MFQPTVDVIPTSRESVDAFAGYNHNMKINGNEFYDMKNLTSSYYPVLSPREQRGKYVLPQGIPGDETVKSIIAKDALCFVSGKTFYINNLPVENFELTADYPKDLISMGAYVIIMPDKMYINTADIEDRGEIENKFEYTGNVKYSLCKADGIDYGIESNVVSESEPAEPVNNQMWIDTSSKPHTLKQYSESSSMWVPIATTYVKISAPGIGAGFKQYDGVFLSGIQSEDLKDFNDKASVLYGAYHDENNPANDYIIIVGIIDEIQTEEITLTVERKLPIMDFVIESSNRLWGCRYGKSHDGTVVNEIYACKQADFKNWYCFMGASTDSYSASCGTDGQWTGAVNYLGYPTFFKENYLHKVYGNYPANYQIQTTECRGVQKGCSRSLAVVNESLFYKSRGGVCVYTGALPTEISQAFGDISYTGAFYTDDYFTTETEEERLWITNRAGAAAGALNNKYYISLNSEKDSVYSLFVFDTSSGLWHKEDEVAAMQFCNCRGELYYICFGENSPVIYSVNGSGIKDETPVRWMAETGTLGTAIPDKKYISRLLIRMSLDVGTRLNFFIEYDSSRVWEKVYSAYGYNLKSFPIPIKPKRCDHFRLRIEGEGKASIYSMVKTLEQGSDL